MKRLLALLMVLCLLPCAGLAEEMAAVEEVLSFEEEPIAVWEEEETVEAVQEEYALEEETVAVEELQPEEAVEELEEPIEPEEVSIEESLEGVVDSGMWGTCAWELSGDGVLTIHAGTGVDNYETEDRYGPFDDYRIESIVTDGTVVLPAKSSCLFAYLYNCTSIDTSGFDTSRVTDMRDMFRGCELLESLDLSGFKTGKVTNMSGMFQGCHLLQSLNLSSFDTRNVTNMSSMFESCYALKSLILTGFNTSRVTDMSSMFAQCFNLTGLDVSGFNTGRVTSMQGMFKDCDDLTSLDVSGFNTSRVTDFSSMFYYCSGLETLNLSSFDTGSAETLAGMFYGCWRLTSLDVSGFRTGSVTDMNAMFGSCSALTELDVRNFDTRNVTDFSDMFNNCSQLGTLDLSSFNTGNAEYMRFMFDSCSALTELDVSGFVTDNVKEMDYMFADCRALTELNVSGFNTGKVTDMNGMFVNCSSLTELDVSGFDTGKVVDMSSMFAGCTLLESLNLRRFNTAAVTDFTWMFAGCAGLARLDLSSFDTSRAYSMHEMLAKSGITSLTVGNHFEFRQTGILPAGEWYSDAASKYFTSTEIEQNRSGRADTYTFSRASGLWGTCPWVIQDGVLTIRAGTGEEKEYTWKSPWDNYAGMIRSVRATEAIVLPANCGSLLKDLAVCTSMDLSGFDTGAVTDMNSMFYGCVKLTSLDLSGFSTSAVTDMSYMFMNCSSLASVKLNSFDIRRVKDLRQMFFNCRSLASLDLSSFRAAQAETLYCMFENCRALKKLNLSALNTPAAVNLNGMFRGCVSLEEVDLSAMDTTAAMNADPEDVSDYGLGEMFAGCTALRLVTVGAKFQTISALGEVNVALPEKTWYSKTTHEAYTAEQIASSRSGVADTYSTKSFGPAKVAGIKGRPVDTNAARLEWTKQNGVSGYQLWRSDNGGAFKWIKNCTTNNVNNYSLTPGANYSYKVRAFSGAGSERVYGEYSDAVDVHILGKITGFTVTGKDTNCAFLKWDAVAGCTGYQVFRTVAGSGEYQWVKNASTPQVANYSLKPGTTYYYKVRAYIDLPGGQRAYGQYSDGIRVYIQPQVNVTLQGGTKQITITWTKADGATGYQIFYTEAGTGGEYKWWKNIPAGTLTATIKNLKANTDYWFKVRSYVDLPDGSRYYGQLSEPQHVWTK